MAGVEGTGMARISLAGIEQGRSGRDRIGEARCGMAGNGTAGKDRRGWAGTGLVRAGMAGMETRGLKG